MNYLHVAIIEDTGDCLVSHTENNLRLQVTDSLALRAIPAMTDEEWADCVKGQAICDVAQDCLPFGIIYYYKTEEKLGELAKVAA